MSRNGEICAYYRSIKAEEGGVAVLRRLTTTQIGRKRGAKIAVEHSCRHALSRQLNTGGFSYAQKEAAL